MLQTHRAPEDRGKNDHALYPRCSGKWAGLGGGTSRTTAALRRIPRHPFAAARDSLLQNRRQRLQ